MPQRRSLNLKARTRIGIDSSTLYDLRVMLQLQQLPRWSTQQPLWRTLGQPSTRQFHLRRWPQKTTIEVRETGWQMTKAPNGTMMPAANAKGTLATRECATVAKEAGEAGEAEVEVLATTSDIRRAIWVEGNICASISSLNTHVFQQTLTANIQSRPTRQAAEDE